MWLVLLLTPMFREHNSMSKANNTKYFCHALHLHIFVHRMLARSSLAQLKNCYVTSIISLVILLSDNLITSVFNTFPTNTLVISSLLCLLSNGMHLYCSLQVLSCWRHTPIQQIDPTSQVNVLPLTAMYMGSLCLLTPQYTQRAPYVQHFLKRVQEFYIERCLQIKKHFSIDPCCRFLTPRLVTVEFHHLYHWQHILLT